MKNHKFFFLFLLIIGVGNSALNAQDLDTTPDPIQLYSMTRNSPNHPYEGHMMITQWIGQEPKIEEANIYFKPPNAYRIEFLLPDGNLDRIVLSDGTQKKVQLLKNGTVVNEYVNKQLPRLLSYEREKELLFINYKVTLIGSETVLGRSTWILELAPASTGKPCQQVRVDGKTHVVLETKKYTQAGSNLSMTRFTRFEPKSTLSDTLFLAATSEEALLKGQINNQDINAGSLLVPPDGYRQALPGGFSLLGADNFELKGNSIRYFKYTDGLLLLSMFETPIPVKVPEEGVNEQTPQSLAQEGPSSSTQSLVWNRGEVYYTIMGDVDSSVLEQIASTFKQ